MVHAAVILYSLLRNRACEYMWTLEVTRCIRSLSSCLTVHVSNLYRASATLLMQTSLTVNAVHMVISDLTCAYESLLT